jgi:glycosyltransferase involved in cell wall biosynthesis
VRILAVSSYGVLGGGELSLAEFLAHRPDDVEVSALLIEDGPLREYLHERGVPSRVGVGYAGRPSRQQLVRYTRSLSRLLEQTAPHVVWATGLKAAFMSAPACRLAGVPLVWHKIDFSLDRVLTRPLAAAVNGVVSVSAAVADAMGPRLRKRRLLAVVGPPVRLPTSLHVVPNHRVPTIGTLATLTPIKGQLHIIEAAAILSREFPRLEVVLAGAASADHRGYAQELRSRAEGLGVGTRVELTGFSSNVEEILRQLTVFVNATYRDEHGFGWEGLSGAMLEASWAGLPVVATRGGGTPDGLKDGVSGTLVEPADPAGIARAVAPFLRDPALARSTGEAGMRFTRANFAPEVAAEKLFGALRQVLDPPRSGHGDDS